MKTLKYNNFEEIISGDEVIIHSFNCWNGKCGIVENINKTDKRAEVFCMEYPDLRYIVREDNLGDIEIIG